jgi:hypothetical protein
VAVCVGVIVGCGTLELGKLGSLELHEYEADGSAVKFKVILSPAQRIKSFGN